MFLSYHLGPKWDPCRARPESSLGGLLAGCEGSEMAWKMMETLIKSVVSLEFGPESVYYLCWGNFFWANHFLVAQKKCHLHINWI